MKFIKIFLFVSGLLIFTGCTDSNLSKESFIPKSIDPSYIGNIFSAGGTGVFERLDGSNSSYSEDNDPQQPKGKVYGGCIYTGSNQEKYMQNVSGF